MPTICVDSGLPLKEALARLDLGHRRILLIIDDDHRLLGVATDSNFRKAMLAGLSFEAPIAEIMTREPVVIRMDSPRVEVLRMMEERHVHEVPVVDGDDRVVDLLLIEEVLSSRAMQRTAVVMAGGLGQRLRPLTDTVPKPLIQVGDRPILFTILDRLIADGFTEIFLAVNYLADQIVDSIGSIPRYRDVVSFLREPKRMGTAGALSLLPSRPTAPLLLTNGDLLTAVDYDSMMRFHLMEDSDITLAVREETFTIPYGVAEIEDGRVVALKEKPTTTHFVNAGVYILSHQVLPLIPADVFFDATDLVQAAIVNGYQVSSFPVREYWLDIGHHDQLQQAQLDYFNAFRPKAPRLE